MARFGRGSKEGGRERERHEMMIHGRHGVRGEGKDEEQGEERTVGGSEAERDGREGGADRGRRE